MNMFFKKKKVCCLAQILEDGRQLADEEMKKPKYKKSGCRDFHSGQSESSTQRSPRL